MNFFDLLILAFYNPRIDGFLRKFIRILISSKILIKPQFELHRTNYIRFFDSLYELGKILFYKTQFKQKSIEISCVLQCNLSFNSNKLVVIPEMLPVNKLDNPSPTGFETLITAESFGHILNGLVRNFRTMLVI